MIIEETPTERLNALIERLRKLVFGQVTRIKTFEEHFLPRESRGSEKAYGYYYGFIRSVKGDHHFTSATHVINGTDLLGLGAGTVQHRYYPPREGLAHIAGTPYRTPRPGANGPSLSQWVVCSPEEILFANYLLSANNTNSLDQIRSTFEGKLDHLSMMARVIILNDIAALLEQRKTGDVNRVDSAVKDVCFDYNPVFWGNYYAQAEEQRIYSLYIPPPAPKPIADRIGSYEPAPGLHTPFVNLEI